MAGSHVAVARYDMLALDLLNSGCIFVGGQTEPVCDVDANATPAPGDSVASAEPEPSAVGSAVPNVSIPPWDGKERLNVLLIGTDQRPREGTYNTDTLIVVSIDPGTKQVAMFSLPRDTVDVPVPPGPARQAFGTVYTRKINAWFTSVRNRADLFPGTDVTRGYNGLKAIIGNLYGLDIKYFVEVNFDGFKSVVDALGGVTINVQIPVVDDRYPGRQREPRADLHPERDPAHGRRPGAAVRPVAPHVVRLRSRPAPAAGPAVAQGAGGPPGADPAPPGADQRRSSGRCARMSRSTSSTSCSGWRRRWTPRTSARTSSPRHSTGRRS